MTADGTSKHARERRRIITQPRVGFLANCGAWGGAFITGTVFALMVLVNPEHRTEVD
jgi:hypothetical protein